jgi:hypothetical protein
VTTRSPRVRVDSPDSCPADLAPGSSVQSTWHRTRDDTGAYPERDRTFEGKVYCAVVLDAFSRRVVGWSIDSSQTAGLVVNALGMAIENRKAEGVVIHSDHGTQGGFNWSSQHLVDGGVDGQAGWLDAGVDGSIGDEVAGAPVAASRDRARVLAEIAKGLLAEEAAAVVGVSQAAGSRWFRQGGGMPSMELAPLAGRYLSFSEREEIGLLRAQGVGVRAIARQLGRAPSTISRELRRNAATRSGRLEYRASVAQWKADLIAQRPKTAKLAVNDRLREYVQERLSGQVRRPDGTPVDGPQTAPWKGRSKPHRGDRPWVRAWSPEQISARLRVELPDDESMRISHEAIYQALFVQSRGALKRELVACLRTGRALRVPRARARRQKWAHVTPEVVISERPAEADDRAVPGHWESQWCCQAA